MVDRPSLRSAHIGTAGLQFALAAAIFRVAGFYRFMDADEGQFLSAIRGVFLGLTPCQDFFYQQTPLFPYPYALAMRVFGYGYEPCLWVSVLCGAGLATVTAAYAAQRGGSLAVGWIGWLLVVTNAQMLFWVPTVKNHAMPLFFGAMALWAASQKPATRGKALAWGFLSGFSALWAVGTRLPAVPLAVAAALWVTARAATSARSEKPSERLWDRRLAGRKQAGGPSHKGREVVSKRSGADAAASGSPWWGLLGFALGAVPPTLLALRSVFPDPWVFYFDLFEFHRLRSGVGQTYGDWSTVSAEMVAMLGQVQFPAMLVAAVLAVFAARRVQPAAGAGAREAAAGSAEWRVEALLALCGAAAVVSALLPRQTFHQYFMVPLLFFWLAAPRLWRRLLSAGSRRGGRAAAGVLLAGHAALCLHHIDYIYPECWALPKVRALGAALRENTTPRDEVFSTWQGFTFFADRADLPGNENFNARTIANYITPRQCARLRIAAPQELIRQVAEEARPAAIAIGFFGGLGPPDIHTTFYADVLYAIDAATMDLRVRSAIERNYRKVPLEDQGYHQLWVRR
jgi:hypothetical protein